MVKRSHGNFCMRTEVFGVRQKSGNANAIIEGICRVFFPRFSPVCNYDNLCCFTPHGANDSMDPYHSATMLSIG